MNLHETMVIVKYSIYFLLWNLLPSSYFPIDILYLLLVLIKDGNLTLIRSSQYFLILLISRYVSSTTIFTIGPTFCRQDSFPVVRSIDKMNVVIIIYVVVFRSKDWVVPTSYRFIAVELKWEHRFELHHLV
jgi:hypothetical protein